MRAFGCAKLPSEPARLAPLHFAGCVPRPAGKLREAHEKGPDLMPGLYFEEFEVGQHFRHAVHRTVTETDNVLFSTLTMNPAALHLDAEYCKTTPFGQPIVNSVFTLGLLVGLSIYDTTFGTTLGNLGWDEVRFPRPVLVGDTLRAETTVVAKRESQSRKDSGVLTFEHRAFNQRNEEVATCKRAALMMKRPAA
jgi:acyl dehydratase